MLTPPEPSELPQSSNLVIVRLLEPSLSCCRGQYAFVLCLESRSYDLLILHLDLLVLVIVIAVSVQLALLRRGLLRCGFLWRLLRSPRRSCRSPRYYRLE